MCYCWETHTVKLYLLGFGTWQIHSAKTFFGGGVRQLWTRKHTKWYFCVFFCVYFPAWVCFMCCIQVGLFICYIYSSCDWSLVSVYRCQASDVCWVTWQPGRSHATFSCVCHINWWRHVERVCVCVHKGEINTLHLCSVYLAGYDI